MQTQILRMERQIINFVKKNINNCAHIAKLLWNLVPNAILVYVYLTTILKIDSTQRHIPQKLLKYLFSNKSIIGWKQHEIIWFMQLFDASVVALETFCVQRKTFFTV